jgi:hypothetical protein
MSSHSSVPRPDSSRPPAAADPPDATPSWLALVADKVKTMRFGVVQITVHEAKVVQIERTERTRFDFIP